MPNRPISINITFILIVLNALLWLAFSIIVAAGLHPAIPDSPLIKWGMAVLALLCSASLLGLLVFLAKRRKVAYILMLALLALISVAIFTDQVGLMDLVALAISVAPMALLVKDRAWYA